MIDQPVNLVEIDLLFGGSRLPMKPQLPPGVYCAIVARREQRPDARGLCVDDPAYLAAATDTTQIA